MSNELERKYEVDIKKTEEKQKITKELKSILQNSGMMDEKGKLKLKGVSPKMLKRMKQEYVDCPVLKENIQFIQCFVFNAIGLCKSFCFVVVCENMNNQRKDG